MEFRRHLVANGVSPAGADEALLGRPVTTSQDQSVIRKLGYYVSPQGEVSLSKSLGPDTALPLDWVKLERKHELRTNYLAHVAVLRGTEATMQLGQAEQFRIASLPPGGKGSSAVTSKSMGAGFSALDALLGKMKLDAGGKSADEARKAKIKALELEIASLQAQMERAARELEAEVAKEIGIMHLANPITFPFFLVVWNQWKQRVHALQKKLIDLLNKLLQLCAELVKLKNS